MVDSPPPARPSNSSRKLWAPLLVSLSYAFVITGVISIVWQMERLPFPIGVSVTLFLFIAGLLQPQPAEARKQSTMERVLVSLVLATVLGGAFILIFRA